MKPSEVIREARSVLFEKGWHRGSMRGADGSVCLLACMCDLAREHRTEVGTAYAHVITLCGGCVPAWNDYPGRTFSEVIDMLDRAEKIAEQQEAAS